jgi:hypothetical protein
MMTNTFTLWPLVKIGNYICNLNTLHKRTYIFEKSHLGPYFHTFIQFHTIQLDTLHTLTFLSLVCYNFDT